MEKRFADKLGVDPNSMPSVVLTKEKHLNFTKAWSEKIGKTGSSASVTTKTASKSEILEAAKEIYACKLPVSFP